MVAEKKISGKVVRFSELTGWDAVRSLELLGKVAGPVFPLLECVDIDDAAERNAALAKAIPEMLKAHDGVAMRELLDLLFANTFVDGDKVIVGVFPGTLQEIIEVAAFTMEKQFGAFFGEAGLAGLLSRLPSAQAASAP